MNFINYAHKTESIKYKPIKLFQLLFSITFSLFIILSAVKLTLVFKPLYYFDINYLNIEEQSNFSKDEIIKNYDYVINYLLDPREEEFHLPSIPYSEVGQIHFKDVKDIFINIDIFWTITGVISFFGLLIYLKSKQLNFLKQMAFTLLMLPLILLTAFFINFDVSFTIFHKIFFRNGYWQFNPDFDPIITILPQEFFFHSSLLILFIIITCSIILRLIYKRKNKLH